MASPPILSEHDFYKTYGGQPGSGRYDRYTANARRPAAPRSAYAPGGVTYRQPTAHLAAHAGAVAAGHGLTLMQQATMLVNKALAPIIAATNQSYDRQGASTSAAIAAAEKEYEAAQAKYAPEVAGAYKSAEGAQAGGDAALANLLTGAGTTGANDLAARLGGLGGAEVPASAQAVGQGSAAAGYGMGSADLSKLISSGASEAAYGAKLPGLAALTGLQDTKSALAELGAKRAEALSQISASGPTQALSLYQNLVARRDARNADAANRAERDKLARESGLISVGRAQTSAQTAAQNRAERAREADQRARTTAAGRSQTAAEKQATLAEQQRHNRASEQNARLAKTGKGGQAATAREKAFYSTRGKAFSRAEQLYKGPSKSNSGGSVVTGGKGGYARPSAQEAYAKLWNLYAPQLVTQYGYKRQTVQQMIRAALKNAGY